MRGRIRRATDPERLVEGLTARAPIRKERWRGEGKASPPVLDRPTDIGLVYDYVRTRIGLAKVIANFITPKHTPFALEPPLDPKS